MNNVLKKITVAATLSLAMMGSASAEYMSLDWQEEGDELAFLDVDAGLEWLKLTETAGLSLNDVQAELGVGGIYEGWRLATVDEVESITEDLTGYAESGSVRYETIYSKTAHVITDFVNLFGWVDIDVSGTSWYTEYDYKSYGLYLDDGVVNMAGVRHLADPKSTTTTHYSSYAYNNYEYEGYSEDYSGVTYAVYLVGDGGATLTTQANMSLVENNPNAAINNVPVFTFGASLLAMGIAGFRKRKV
jgi:hypothetical protein